jgi:hypothetical protein
MISRQTIIDSQPLLTRLFIINRFEFAGHQRVLLPSASDLLNGRNFTVNQVRREVPLSDKLLGAGQYQQNMTAVGFDKRKAQVSFVLDFSEYFLAR